MSRKMMFFLDGYDGNIVRLYEPTNRNILKLSSLFLLQMTKLLMLLERKEVVNEDTTTEILDHKNSSLDYFSSNELSFVYFHPSSLHIRIPIKHVPMTK